MQAKPMPRHAMLALLVTGLAGGLSSPATAGSTLDVPGPLELTIQEAIDIAESLAVTQLNITPGGGPGPGGVYPESLAFPANGYDLVLMGNPNDPSQVVIDPSLADPPIFDSVVHVLGGQTAATQLIGLTLTGGDADGIDDGDPDADDRGGGLFVSGSDATVSNCVFVDNIAALVGGGVAVNAGTVTFDNCHFEQDQAKIGGGAYVTQATTTFTDCTFLGNEATLDTGGGMRSSNSTTTLTRCTFEGNTAIKGGGVTHSGGSMTIVASELVDNMADPGLGGGLAIFAGTVDARDTIFNGNSAGSAGGAIYAGAGTSLTLVNATVVNNQSGISGEVIFGGGTKTVRSSIVWNNGGTIGEGTNNVTWSMVQGGFAGTGNIDPPGGPDFVDVDGPDDLLGTADDDLRLSAGSPAIDAGDASAVIGQYPLDLDGLPRALNDPDTPDTGLAVLGVPVDMGAYELQPAPAPPSCPTDINGDGVTNVLDLIQLLLSFGAVCP